MSICIGMCVVVGGRVSLNTCLRLRYVLTDYSFPCCCRVRLVTPSLSVVVVNKIKTH